MQLSPGKIFLADGRGRVENEEHQLFSTFNFGEYYSEHKMPFGTLHTFNDQSLPAAGRVLQHATVTGIMLIVPITGTVIYNQLEVEPGQIWVVPVTMGISYALTNPYPSDWINFLCIEIKVERLLQISKQMLTFDMEQNANLLIPVGIGTDLPVALHIGRFGGRVEITHGVRTGHKVFAFVIGGAFELQNRLLHERDGLGLWNVSEVGAEALSNDAVLLLLELRDANDHPDAKAGSKSKIGR